MTKLEIEFLEEYKRLDKLCQDMLSSLSGVSEYINRMESFYKDGSYYIDDWNESYKTLKHLRWLRNNIVHNVDESDCSLEELETLKYFYRDILMQEDPLARLYKNNKSLEKNKKRLNKVDEDKVVDNKIENKQEINFLLFVGLIIIFICLIIFYNGIM